MSEKEKVKAAPVSPAAGKTEVGELEEMSRLLQEQLATSEAILQEVATIKGHIRWQKIWATLRFFLIVVPVVLGLLYGLLYLPPEVKEVIDYYRSLYRP